MSEYIQKIAMPVLLCNLSIIILLLGACIDRQSPVYQGVPNQAGERMTELYDNKNCKEFIDAFPKTIQELDQLYGFDDEEGERILLSRSEEHISYFFDCEEVSDREKLNKVIQMGIGGKWDADAIGMFQYRSLILVRDNLDDAKTILDVLPDDRAASFWYFLFDGPHPNNLQGTVDMFISSLGRESKQSKLLSERYEKLKADWKNH